jgi:hypothetical protein
MSKLRLFMVFGEVWAWIRHELSEGGASAEYKVYVCIVIDMDGLKSELVKGGLVYIYIIYYFRSVVSSSSVASPSRKGSSPTSTASPSVSS